MTVAPVETVYAHTRIQVVRVDGALRCRISFECACGCGQVTFFDLDAAAAEEWGRGMATAARMIRAGAICEGTA